MLAKLDAQAQNHAGRRDLVDRQPSRQSGLNITVRYHVAVPDGVFSRGQLAGQGFVFHQLPIPNCSDIEAIEL